MVEAEKIKSASYLPTLLVSMSIYFFVRVTRRKSQTMMSSFKNKSKVLILLVMLFLCALNALFALFLLFLCALNALFALFCSFYVLSMLFLLFLCALNALFTLFLLFLCALNALFALFMCS